MDDGGPSATAFLFIMILLADILIYGFGAALHNLRSDDIEKKAQENGNDRKSAVLLRILNNPSGYVNTVQLAVMVINLMIGRWYLEYLGSLFAGCFGYGDSFWMRFTTEILAGVILVYAVMTIGVLLPKRLASRNPERWAYACVGMINMILTLFYPMVKLISDTTSGILHIMGIRDESAEADVTEEEIRSMVTEGQEQGVLQDSEADMITNIFEFSDKQAKDIMTHRNTMVGIDGNMNLRDAIAFMLEKNNSRFPVYLDNIDHIIGILHIRDAMKKLSENESDASSIRRIKGLLRQPMYVPETKNIDALFHSMQLTKTQMVIVIDEYGQTSGLVSMEDILEEIVGNIMDEYDEDEDYIESTDNANEFIIEGKTPLEDLEDKFGILFDQDEYETLNGLLIAKLDRIPNDDEDFSVDMNGYNFKILMVRNHMIQSVLVTKLPEEDEPADKKQTEKLQEQ
ncbi:MAG: HlyC/CorC family transporter [Butyrivibrio sp.]|nr:HlyC/CorC family transporter [Butyrivibrio sp.]